MAGKKRYSAEKMIEAARRYRGLKSRMAAALGCSVQTITNYERDMPTVAEAIAEQRGRLVDLAEKGLEDAIRRGNVTAIIFALKTIGADRGYKEPPREFAGDMRHSGRLEHEHSGPRKPPPERKESFDELMEELDSWRAELDDEDIRSYTGEAPQGES